MSLKDSLIRRVKAIYTDPFTYLSAALGVLLLLRLRSAIIAVMVLIALTALRIDSSDRYLTVTNDS